MPRDQAPAASTTRVGRNARAVLEHDAGGAAGLHRDFRHRAVLVDSGAGGLRGNAQRVGELAVVDLMILRAEH